jgi:IMP dehydrogenase
MIVDPVTVQPEQPIAEALAIMQRSRISGLPVPRGGQLVGIPDQPGSPLREAPRPHRRRGDDARAARDRWPRHHAYRIEKPPVVDEKNQLQGAGG